MAMVLFSTFSIEATCAVWMCVCACGVVQCNILSRFAGCGVWDVGYIYVGYMWDVGCEQPVRIGQRETISAKRKKQTKAKQSKAKQSKAKPISSRCLFCFTLCGPELVSVLGR